MAPYESDPQLYSMYRDNKIDYIYSEDSDIVALGCWHVVKNIRLDKSCSFLDEISIKELQKRVKSKEGHEGVRFKRVLDFFELEDMDWIKVCVYSGCDYLSNLNGVGFATSMKMVALGKLDHFIEKVLD